MKPDSTPFATNRPYTIDFNRRQNRRFPEVVVVDEFGREGFPACFKGSVVNPEGCVSVARHHDTELDEVARLGAVHLRRHEFAPGARKRRLLFARFVELRKRVRVSLGNLQRQRQVIARSLASRKVGPPLVLTLDLESVRSDGRMQEEDLRIADGRKLQW